jgi:hypothetical protein
MSAELCSETDAAFFKVIALMKVGAQTLRDDTLFSFSFSKGLTVSSFDNCCIGRHPRVTNRVQCLSKYPYCPLRRKAGRPLAPKFVCNLLS